MRLFGGFSFPLIGRARAGVSRRGNLWAGARAGAGPLYLGVLSSTSSRSSSARKVDHGLGEDVLVFAVDDDGRVFLGDAELDLEHLRGVVIAADEARRR